MFRRPNRLAADARGAVAIEYALIVALIVLAIITGVTALGGSLGTAWSNMAAKVTAA